MTLSVIIPIYNAKASLTRCVDSVVLQELLPDGNASGTVAKPDVDVAELDGNTSGTVAEPSGTVAKFDGNASGTVANVLEVVLIDDGSTDGSGEMCDNFKRQYEDESCKIVVVHQETKGLLAARNVGIAASTGELVTFVDAEDFLGKNTYSKQMEFFACADDVDVVEFPVSKFYNDFLKKESLAYAVDFYNTVQDYLFDTDAQKHPFLFNKIFKREVLMKALENCAEKNVENELLCAAVLRQARRIVTNDDGYYFHTLVEGKNNLGRNDSENAFFEALIIGKQLTIKQKIKVFLRKIGLKK